MDATTVAPAGAPGWPAPQEFRNIRVHMVGIAGSGMSGLAAVLLHHGACVSGSDRNAGAILRRLERSGARVTSTQSAESVPADADLIVASAAIPPDHPELVAARRRGLHVIKYAQLLGALMGQRDGLAIAGTHGKSTTTAWLAFALRRAGLDPSFVVGAECEQLGGGSGVGEGRHFLAEACEYDRSFLHLRPKAAAVLNIEEDHLDYYGDLNAICDAFAQFVELLPPDGLLVSNAHDPRCQQVRAGCAAKVETFGWTARATWSALNLRAPRGLYEFTLMHGSRRLGRVALGIPGRHNVLNALAVVALARFAGVPWDVLVDALGEFRGARRRLELRGELQGVRVADDYAHHPTEIRATLRAARERYQPRRLWCVFQPHQHSRTRFLLEDFARSFAAAERVIVPDIYFVRDSERERALVSAADLVQRINAAGGCAVHLPQTGDIVDLLLREAQAGDLVLTMGAGDIYKVADELVARLRSDRAA